MGVKLTCHDCGAAIDSDNPMELTEGAENGDNMKTLGLYDDCLDCGGFAVDNEVTHYVLGHLWFQTPEEYAEEERLRAKHEQRLLREPHQKAALNSKSPERAHKISSRFTSPIAAFLRVFLFLFGVSWLCKSVYMAVFQGPSWEILSNRSAGPIVMPIVVSTGLIVASLSPGSIWKNATVQWVVWFVFCLIVVFGFFIGVLLAAESVLSPLLGANHWLTGIVGWISFVALALLADGLYEAIRDRKRSGTVPTPPGSPNTENL